MYDTLLFLHVLSAFLLGAAVVMLSAVALGAVLAPRSLFLADRLWDVGGLGTLVFGIWLAIHEDEYDLFDGWVLGAIVLWFVATGLAMRARQGLEPPAAWTRLGVQLHWARTLVVIGFLVLMIWKPGA
jgi:hypothetical protein